MTAQDDLTGMEQAGARAGETWEALVAAQAALLAADQARSRTLYLAALALNVRRAEEYGEAIGALLRQQGE